MTIDLTGPVPHVTQTCDCCARPGPLYRLIGTAQVLCRECFARLHA
jgi:hypothetical protein